jgi:glyoxylase-like metal-dependent hydrolase (beta-lactamase superfamily II)
MQVTKDIYMVLGGAYANIANIFVIKGKNALVMIDTAENTDELAVIDENLHYWGLDSYPISHVLISHKHFNHIGNAHILQKRGALIAAGEPDAAAIENGDINGINDFGPFPVKEDYIPCKVDIKVRDGDIIHAAGLDFDVIGAPGHTDGSVFYRLKIDGKVVLFTGDVVNSGPDCRSALLGWEGGADFNRETYFASIKRFSTMPCDLLLSGHYQLCMWDGWKILQGAYAKALTQWQSPSVLEE